MRARFKMKIFTDKRYKTCCNFAKACGKTENWISRLLTGRDDPSEDDKRLICEKLGVSLDKADNLFKLE